MEGSRTGCPAFLSKYIVIEGNPMKKKKSLGLGWSILLLTLVVCLIAIFVPKGVQGPSLFFALVAWNVWATSTKLVPFIHEKVQQRADRKAHKEDQQTQRESVKTQAMQSALSLHVNLRITEHLHTIYPKATWAWLNKDPLKLILEGGIGRIRINGADDYEFADIKIEKSGNIGCSMIKHTHDFKANRIADATSPAAQPLNPQIWYEKQGRTVLQNVITDLHSRGHSSLTVNQDGSILIHENEDIIAQNRLADFPERAYWPQLIQVLQRDGLAAKIEPKGLQLTW